MPGMAVTLIAVVGVISVVVLAVFAERLGLAAPLLLVVVGAALGFAPGLPDLQVAPDLILAGVLPPLLYSAAVNMPATDFRRNFGVISSLAVVLVVVTTLGAGWLLHALIPGLSWPAAFAVGAVISPTDAVAATSVGRRLGLPSRLLTVLEGEGLVNDASALVLLRAAIAAMAAAVSVWDIALQFAFSVVVAVLVGAAVGLINVRVRARLNDPVLNTAISFVIPFVAYWPAEHFEASGVLAVVVAGVVTGHQGPRYLSARDRLTERTNWRTLAFLLESGIFLFMGLALKPLIDEVGTVWDTVLLGLALSALVIVIRIVFTAPMMAMVRRDERRAAESQPRIDRMQSKLDSGGYDERLRPRQKERLQHRLTQVNADVQWKLSQGLGWRGGVVLAWSGMRGAITVAAAQTLPDDTPYRPQLILIAFVVAATTLLLQGATLPAVIRTAKVPGDDPVELRQEYDRLLDQLGRSGQEVLDEAEPGTDPVVMGRARQDSALRDIAAAPEGTDVDAGREAYRRLRLRVLAAQRRTLLADRAVGTYRAAVLDRAQLLLDSAEISLQPVGDEIERV